MLRGRNPSPRFLPSPLACRDTPRFTALGPDSRATQSHSISNLLDLLLRISYINNALRRQTRTTQYQLTVTPHTTLPQFLSRPRPLVSLALAQNRITLAKDMAHGLRVACGSPEHARCTTQRRARTNSPQSTTGGGFPRTGTNRHPANVRATTSDQPQQSLRGPAAPGPRPPAALP